MSEDFMNMNVGLDVSTSGVELVEILTQKLKKLQEQLAAINSGIRSTARAATSSPGRDSTATKATTDAARTARDALGIDRDRLRVLKMRMDY